MLSLQLGAETPTSTLTPMRTLRLPNRSMSKHQTQRRQQTGWAASSFWQGSLRKSRPYVEYHLWTILSWLYQDRGYLLATRSPSCTNSFNISLKKSTYAIWQRVTARTFRRERTQKRWERKTSAELIPALCLSKSREDKTPLVTSNSIENPTESEKNEDVHYSLVRICKAGL